MMGRLKITWLILLGLLFIFETGDAIQCYECDSNEDYSCPTYEAFDKEINAPIDCNSFEANVPGQFCMKITQESPGWRGWKKITRRCGSRTDLGVAWGCRWSWDHVGVFKEICYCESDRCNSAPPAVKSGLLTTLMFGLFGIAFKYLLL